MFCVAEAACSSLSPAREAVSGPTEGESNSPNQEIQVEIEWTYQDQDRFAIEVFVKNYPLPPDFQLLCPITQLEVSDVGENQLLYRNPDQINLDEFYALARNNRWYCTKQADGDGFADYLFSLSHFYEAGSVPGFGAEPTIRLELGEVAATNSVSVRTLPALGVFDLPLQIQPSAENLSWLTSGKIAAKGITVLIQQILVNPSVTWLDACLDYDDHHLWRPTAELVYQGQRAHSIEWLGTFPLHPADRGTILQSTHRCYSFSIPFTFPLDSPAPFQIGIGQVQIDNTDPGVVTMQECEAVKDAVESSHLGLEIRCYAYETRGQPQHWFEVVARPPELSTLAAYDLVESAFVRTIEGSWTLELQMK